MGAYEISPAGQIRRVDPGHGARVGLILKQYKTANGYLVVYPRDGKRNIRRYVHHLVAEIFLGKRKLGRSNKDWQINHIDGDKQNNRLENLEYLRRIDNCSHARQLNLYESGEDRWNSRFSVDDIIEIRKRAAEGPRGTMAALAREFKVSQSHIRQIVDREIWRHLK